MPVGCPADLAALARWISPIAPIIVFLVLSQRVTPLQAQTPAPPAKARPAPARPAARSPAARPPPRALPPARPVPTPRRQPWFHLSYLADWGVSLALGGASLGLDRVKPVDRAFRADDPAIGRPRRVETVPAGYLALAFGIPVVAIGLAQARGGSWHDLHHGLLGLSEALALTLFVTSGLKAAVGRLRPDFLARCQPDPSLRCQGDPDELAEGRRSFPSGHASIAFAGATYLSLYLWGRLGPLRKPGDLWMLPILLAPLGAAALVAASRVVDHVHHWEDVVAGSALGAGFAVLAYALNYHAPWSRLAGRPRRRAQRVTIVPSAGPGTAALSLWTWF